jgi:hypothetical protein
MFFNLLEKAKVSAGAGFKRFLAKVGSTSKSSGLAQVARVQRVRAEGRMVRDVKAP